MLSVEDLTQAYMARLTTCHVTKHTLAHAIPGCSAAQPPAVRSSQPCMIQCASCHDPKTHLGK